MSSCCIVIQPPFFVLFRIIFDVLSRRITYKILKEYTNTITVNQHSNYANVQEHRGSRLCRYNSFYCRHTNKPISTERRNASVVKVCVHTHTHTQKKAHTEHGFTSMCKHSALCATHLHSNSAYCMPYNKNKCATCSLSCILAFLRAQLATFFLFD